MLNETLQHLSKRTRSLNVRLLVTAHEPMSIPPALLDTASFIVCHKLTSTAACDHLAPFVQSDEFVGSHREAQWRRQLLEIFPGEAVIFSSSALVLDESETPEYGVFYSYFSGENFL